MKNKYTHIILPAVALLVGLGIAGAVGVKAASNGQSQNPMGNLVNAIAQKFNLNPTDVQQVVDDQRKLMNADHQQRLTDRFTQAVADGKLTQDQSDKIVAKMKELQAKREAEKDSLGAKTEAERQAMFQQQIADLKQWAQDNSIPDGFLPFGRPMGGHHQGMMGSDNAGQLGFIR